MTISQLNPAPAQRLGQRLTPGPLETLPTCLLGGVILFVAWSGSTWFLASLAALGLIALGVSIIAGLRGRRRRPRRGAIVHQRFANSGCLGWSFGAIFLGSFVAAFWLPILFDLHEQPLWIRAAVAIAFVVVGWACTQALLRARARAAGSPDGGLTTTSTSSSGAAFRDPLDLAIADLLSRTQMMRVDALTEDLAMPGDQLRSRLEDLLARGLVDRKRRDDGAVDDHHWVHLTFHGEQQLAAALQSTSANTP